MFQRLRSAIAHPHSSTWRFDHGGFSVRNERAFDRVTRTDTPASNPIMVSACRLNRIICIISFMFCHCAAVGPSCSAAVFGVPPWNDCLAAFNKVPFAEDYETNRNANLTRLYSEPQYLRPPFGEVFNRYAPRAINQMPKIWQHSKL